jgi:hypothetical protein
MIGPHKPVYTLDHPAKTNLSGLRAPTLEAAELDGRIPATRDKGLPGATMSYRSSARGYQAPERQMGGSQPPWPCLGTRHTLGAL